MFLPPVGMKKSINVYASCNEERREQGREEKHERVEIEGCQ